MLHGPAGTGKTPSFFLARTPFESVSVASAKISIQFLNLAAHLGRYLQTVEFSHLPILPHEGLRSTSSPRAAVLGPSPASTTDAIASTLQPLVLRSRRRISVLVEPIPQIHAALSQIHTKRSLISAARD
jgi:hypothetical protein